MDIKKYISSGVLELYVFGMLSEEERKTVDRYVSEYPEIKAEVNKIEQSLELYAEGGKMKASADLEQSIMDKIDQTPRELPIKTKQSSSNNWLAYLLGLLLIGSIIAAYSFYNNYQKSQTTLKEAQANHQILEEDCQQKDQVIESLSNEVELLLNANNVRVNMPGTGNAPQALASVFYNKEDKKSYLDIGNLPAPPSDQFYQLWALVDGAPVDMGEFEITSTGDTVLIEVPFIENAGAFAVTLEVRDGNPAPNLDALQVFGEVSS